MTYQQILAATGLHIGHGIVGVFAAYTARYHLGPWVDLAMPIITMVAHQVSMHGAAALQAIAAGPQK